MNWAERLIFAVQHKRSEDIFRKERNAEIRKLLNDLTVGEKNMLQRNIQKSYDATSLNKYDKSIIVPGLPVKLRGEELFLYPLPGRSQVCVVDFTEFMLDFKIYMDTLKMGEELSAGITKGQTKDEMLNDIRWMRLRMRDPVDAPFHDKNLAAECLARLEEVERKLEEGTFREACNGSYGS